MNGNRKMNRGLALVLGAALALAAARPALATDARAQAEGAGGVRGGTLPGRAGRVHQAVRGVAASDLPAQHRPVLPGAGRARARNHLVPRLPAQGQGGLRRGARRGRRLHQRDGGAQAAARGGGRAADAGRRRFPVPRRRGAPHLRWPRNLRRPHRRGDPGDDAVVRARGVVAVLYALVVLGRGGAAPSAPVSPSPRPRGVHPNRGCVMPDGENMHDVVVGLGIAGGAGRGVRRQEGALAGAGRFSPRR